MKKGEYWFSKLSETEQQQFKYCTTKNGNNFDSLIKLDYPDFELFIMTFFTWSTTADGWEYWYNISKRDVK